MAVLPAVGFAVALGGARLPGFVLVVAGGAGFLAVLRSSRAERDASTARLSRLVLHHCDTLEKRHGRKWAVKDWRQDVDILANGDARQRIAFTIVARCDELNFVSFTDRVNWDWPERFKRRVQVHVRSVEVGGEGGTRFEVSTSWLDDRKLKTFVHLDNPVPRDGEVSLVVDMFWPAKCRPLMRGHAPDEMLVRFGEPIPLAQYVITFPEGYHVRVDKVGLSAGDGYALSHVLDRWGRPEITLLAEDVPAYHLIGLKLDTLPR
ncbi:hypothetical protein [Saccharothrix variisporea]|uniref:Uncharacterized protein n=1 Tax=Saccharothrix variisporea TaxID=543527 RepID=A0A495XB81_9PSEU|nr:hypothetical protein [Saccharothrix variisporea]RKT71721.1 hypothetical protein DFJ66_5016 [Saccharothrix variisporea]